MSEIKLTLEGGANPTWLANNLRSRARYMRDEVGAVDTAASLVAIADQIEAQLPKAPVEEPTEQWSVVRATDRDGWRTERTLVHDKTSYQWVGVTEEGAPYWLNWAHLRDVEVLRVGIGEPAPSADGVVLSTLKLAEIRMFGTVDGDLLSDESELPVGELRRLLWTADADDITPWEIDGGLAAASPAEPSAAKLAAVEAVCAKYEPMGARNEDVKFGANVVLKAIREVLATPPAEAVEAAEAVSPALMMEEFNRRGGVDVSRPARPTVAVDGAIQRVEFVEEEAQEFREAIEAGDLVKTADALGDLAYAVYGAAWRFGIDLDAVIAEVHRSNMTKTASAGDGKAIKGAGYSAPNFARILGLPEPSPVQIEAEPAADLAGALRQTIDEARTRRLAAEVQVEAEPLSCTIFPHCALEDGHAGWCLKPNAPAEDDPIEALVQRLVGALWSGVDNNQEIWASEIRTSFARVLEVGGQRALTEAAAAARQEAVDSRTNNGRSESEGFADWLDEYAKTVAS